ncbi:MAG: flagellar hook protein FlgE [Chromatiaceae bacterium]
MGFEAGTSGLRAASADLDVIGNNVANANTTGFKSSRAEFADVYATSVFGASSTSTGNGVRLSDVAQQFTQGTVSFTNNNLDLAVNGQGFFRLNDGGSTIYTRAGAFSADRDGYLVNSSQQRLTGYVADADGTVTGQLGDLRIDTSNIEPSATERVDGALNLDANSVAPLAAWDDSNLPPPPSSYNNSTSLTIYDSLGNSHELSLYFVSTGADREWDVHTLIDGEVVGNAQQIGFDESGAIDPTTAEWQLAGWTPANAAGQPIDISLIETTQYGSLFGVNSLTQDGYTTGQLAGVDIDASGVIFGRYTNGQSKALGQVALANFANPGGLQPLGDTNWAETYSSGAALLGAPGSASLGVLQSGALEESNVDLTQELVKLILAQRNFQANAQTIRAADTVTQTIINIR